LENKQYAVDEEAAEIVRYIFKLADEGVKRKEIARRLNRDGVPSRRDYKNNTTGNYLWRGEDIVNLLHNEVYIGTLVNRKTTTIAPNVRKKNDDSNKIKIENHHIPIISKELFDRVNSQYTPNRKGLNRGVYYSYELSGKVKCGNCGKTMFRKTSTNKKNVFYKCDIRIDENCFTDKISPDTLKDVVINTFNIYMRLVIENFEKIKQEVKSQKQAVQADVDKIIAEIESLQHQKLILYTEYKEGLFSKKEFLLKREQISDKIDKLTDKKKMLEQGVDISNQEQTENFIKKYNRKEFTAETIIDEYVKAIYVYSTDRIEIEWKFKDIFE
jgi:hypothetical protein